MGFGFSLIFFILCVRIMKRGDGMLLEIEFFVLELLQKIHFDLLDTFMVAVTSLGNGGAIWIAIGVIMLFFKKYRRTGIAVLLGLLMGLLIGNLGIKNLVARERPCAINTAIELLIPFPSEYSFPSGHTLSSFIASTVIFLNSKRLGIYAYVLASLIAFSRLYLYVHFPTDIIGGIVLGLLLGAFSHWILKRLTFKE